MVPLLRAAAGAGRLRGVTTVTGPTSARRSDRGARSAPSRCAALKPGCVGRRTVGYGGAGFPGTPQAHPCGLRGAASMPRTARGIRRLRSRRFADARCSVWRHPSASAAQWCRAWWVPGLAPPGALRLFFGWGKGLPGRARRGRRPRSPQDVLAVSRQTFSPTPKKNRLSATGGPYNFAPHGRHAMSDFKGIPVVTDAPRRAAARSTVRRRASPRSRTASRPARAATPLPVGRKPRGCGRRCRPAQRFDDVRAHGARAPPRHGLRGGEVPEHRRVLERRHRDDHADGRGLHARLPLLCGRHRQSARLARCRGAGERGAHACS